MLSEMDRQKWSVKNVLSMTNAVNVAQRRVQRCPQGATNDAQGALMLVAACLPGTPQSFSRRSLAFARPLASGDNSPALVIIAHTRKPAIGDRAPRGRRLLHEVAGSLVLGAHARCVFSLLAPSDDLADDRVVFENPKNNDGEQARPTAWHRRNGLFAPCPDFDWKTYNRQHGAKGRAMVGIGDLREVFEQAGGVLTRQQAARALMDSLECSASVAYDALSQTGRFAEYLRIEGKNLRWVEPDGDSESEHA